MVRFILTFGQLSVIVFGQLNFRSIYLYCRIVSLEKGNLISFNFKLLLCEVLYRCQY